VCATHLNIACACTDDTPAAVYRGWLQQHAADITLVLLTDTTAQSPLDTAAMRVDNVTSLLVSAFERMHFQTLLLTGELSFFLHTLVVGNSGNANQFLPVVIAYCECEFRS
jgi:hypothetical protein